MLHHILNTFDVLSISKLIWTKDTFQGIMSDSRTKMFSSIQQKIVKHLPKLKHFSFGINDFSKTWSHGQGYSFIDPSPQITKSIFIPVITGYDQLQLTFCFLRIGG